MHKYIVILLSLGLSLSGLAKAQANPSVTIYALDDFQPALSTQTQTSAAVKQAQPPPQSTPTTTTAKTSTTPEPGLFGAHWSGRANIGASLQTGNTEQDAINIDNTINAKWLDTTGKTKHRAFINTELNLENEDDETTEDNRKLELGYDYFFKPKWFLDTFISFEQDDIDQLDLRTNLSLGIGHQHYESDALNLQYTLGASLLNEEFENNSEDSAAARWALDYDQKLWDEAFQIFHKHELIVPVDEADAYLLDTKTGLRMPLRKGLVTTAEIEFDRDNAPEPGVKKDDTTYAFKLGYEW